MQLEIRELSTTDKDFEQQFAALLARGVEFDPAVDAAVAEIIHAVRTRGDAALLEYTQRHDGHLAASVAELEVSFEELENAYQRLSPALRETMLTAHDRIMEFHYTQADHMYWDWHKMDGEGSLFGQKTQPIERVGVYIPGGLAAYPSTVLMTLTPAFVAEVSETIMVVPAPNGTVKDSVLAAAQMAFVDRVFTIGGAQAIAALAYGTETVPKVDKIVGPGNIWVSAAKRQVFGHVGIDTIAGPSEVVVACDDGTHAEWAAMDMFAQAEHDESTQSILLSIGRDKMNEVRNVMSTLLPEMERRDIIARSLANQGALICVRDRDELVALVNRIAPEHLGLMVADAHQLLKQVQHAGSIFVGQHSAEVFGDYCAGPNHVLPTSGAARFSSPLGVQDFVKQHSFFKCSPRAAGQLAEVAGELARAEQLPAHARAADLRKQQPVGR